MSVVTRESASRRPLRWHGRGLRRSYKKLPCLGRSL